MIKTIIFDNQGVLTDKDEDGTLETMSRSFRFDYDKVRPHYHKVREQIDTGEVSSDEFYELMAGLFDDVEDKKEIADYHIGLYPRRPEVYAFVRGLKKKYKIALLTNFCDRFHEFNEKWQLDEFFPKENMFVSAELKMRKPDHNIFKHVLSCLNNKPEEVVFIDDDEKNVKAARELGMHGIQFMNLEQLKVDLEKLLRTEKASV